MKRQLAEPLHAVHMKDRVGRALSDEGLCGGKVVDRACFVVDLHERNECRIFRKRFGKRIITLDHGVVASDTAPAPMEDDEEVAAQ